MHRFHERAIQWIIAVRVTVFCTKIEKNVKFSEKNFAI